MLTDTQCRTAKPKDKPYKLSDGQGLYLEVKPSGVKAWRYRFKLSNPDGFKESMFAIGEYAVAPIGETPDQAMARRAGGRFTLSEARQERVKARGLVKQGVNPAHQRQLERLKRVQDSAVTFEALAKEWISLRDWEDVTKLRRLDMLKRVVFPRIGPLPVRDVTPAHMLEVIKTAHEKNGPSVAAEAKRTVSGVYAFAVSTLRADTDPTYHLRGALPSNKTQHKRALDIQEIGRLLRDVETHGGRYETVSAFRLMWLTLCRPSEVIEARWEEFDLNNAVWKIPAERMKKRKEHIVPLPAQALELLKGMHTLTGRLDLVFPNRDNRKRPMTTATFRQMLHVLGWSGKFSPHATRTTGSTRLNEMGYSFDWIERQLAHADTNVVRRTYNHATYLEQRAGMMQQWADMLDTWKRGGEVHPIRAEQVAR